MNFSPIASPAHSKSPYLHIIQNQNSFMKWFIIKGALMAFPIFIVMGIVGNLFGLMSLSIFSKTGKDNINGFLKFSIFLSFVIGAIFYTIMGMFYASFTLLLTSYMVKWLAIILVAIFLIFIVRYNYKEVRSLHNKNLLFASYDFYDNGKYSKHSQVVNENVLLGFIMLFPAYIFFLIFPSLADKVSFGLNSYLISFFK
jgi:hypothetical protein